MRLPVLLILIAALAAAALVIVIGQRVINPPRDLIANATVSPEIITPNADGRDDVTLFAYTLTRNARVSIQLENEGMIYHFRQDEPRTVQDYQVAFSGVVDGFTLPDDAITDGQQIARRLMPDGVYTWTLTATDAEGIAETRTGTLTLQDGDAPLPYIPEFTVSPETFTPNQDGISDRVYANVVIAKDSTLEVSLIGENGARYLIPERLETILPGAAGRHTFDYEGGVDNGADPPPDGTYTLIASAQDVVGQRVERQTTITLDTGGKPYGQILRQSPGVSVVFERVSWEERYAAERDIPGALIDPPSDPDALTLTTIQMPLGDMLVFKLTVENNGDVPIRTTGPEPGTVYAWDQNASTLGWFEESGAWRVAIDCTTAARDYPWRWALGNTDDLVAEVNPLDGETYYYLPPGARSIVYGAIRMTQLEVYNPQSCWAGLIHEGVNISEFNGNVGTRQIELVPLNGETPALPGSAFRDATAEATPIVTP